MAAVRVAAIAPAASTGIDRIRLPVPFPRRAHLTEDQRVGPGIPQLQNLRGPTEDGAALAHYLEASFMKALTIPVFTFASFAASITCTT